MFGFFPNNLGFRRGSPLGQALQPSQGFDPQGAMTNLGMAGGGFDMPSINPGQDQSAMSGQMPASQPPSDMPPAAGPVEQPSQLGMANYEQFFNNMVPQMSPAHQMAIAPISALWNMSQGKQGGGMFSPLAQALRGKTRNRPFGG